LGLDPNDNSDNVRNLDGIGNVACRAVLALRHHDEHSCDDGDTALDDVHRCGEPGRHLAPLPRLHFAQGDLNGREVGRLVGEQAYDKALTYINGTAGDRY